MAQNVKNVHLRKCRGTLGITILPFLFLFFSHVGSISPHVIFAELAEAPWQRTWWSQVLRFMHRLDNMDEGSLHPDVFE